MGYLCGLRCMTRNHREVGITRIVVVSALPVRFRAGVGVVKGRVRRTSVYRFIGVWQQESGKGPRLANGAAY